MHKRTLRKLAAQLDRLEQAASEPSREEAVAEAFASYAAAGAMGEEYAAAYRAYLTAREALEERQELPPDAYRPGQPEGHRVRRWRLLDSPLLSGAVDSMLRMILAAIGR